MDDVEFKEKAPMNTVRKRELEAQIQALQLFSCLFVHACILRFVDMHALHVQRCSYNPVGIQR